MNKRDRYLLTQGYSMGYLHASFVAHNGEVPLERSAEDEAEEWVEEAIADNGGTCGQYISSQAPINDDT